MEVTVTVDLDEAFLRGVVEHALRKSLAQPSYHDGKGAEGYERIVKVARDYVLRLDVTDLVRTAAASMVDGIVRDVVGELLRRKVREAARIEQQDGTLFSAK